MFPDFCLISQWTHKICDSLHRNIKTGISELTVNKFDTLKDTVNLADASKDKQTTTGKKTNEPNCFLYVGRQMEK